MSIVLGIVIYLGMVALLLRGIHNFEKENKEREANAHLKEYFERRYRKDELHE